MASNISKIGGTFLLCYLGTCHVVFLSVVFSYKVKKMVVELAVIKIKKIKCHNVTIRCLLLRG